MKLNDKSGTQLVPDNLPNALEGLARDGTNAYVLAAYALIADMLDAVISGECMYVTFGLNAKKSTLLVTFNAPGGGKTFVTGLSLDEIIYQWASNVADERAGSLLVEAPRS